MLVLSRKVNEEIIIGDNIRVTVVRVDGNRIRLGISAPAHVAIRREEVPAEEHAPPDPRRFLSRRINGLEVVGCG